MATTQYEKLQRLLRELFRTDQADLDFGIYRVINQRRDEINKFLEEDLLPQVQKAFSEYQFLDNQSLAAQLQEAIKQAEDLGVEPEEAPKVKEIKEQLANYGVDIVELENQVYAALYNFFRRYYDKGDFISQRRYKEGVYAIPYEGEEVKLHWANHGQYYIKTSEHFRNYTFKLKSGKLAHVKLVSADTEKDNRKEADDSKRRFILADDPLVVEDGQLEIRFEFRADEQKRKQEKLNQEAIENIFALREKVQDPIIKQALIELANLAPTEADKQRTLLAKHLSDYTRRNTQDYFIHKDLGKFLRQELDFYIKNEIMHLDDIESETAPRVEQYLSKIKVIRKIAHKIIAFLAQIEDFQKKLWLKKKFVVETNYCITLDRVPEELYLEIAANDAQREEWIFLFAIEEIKGDMFAEPYTEPLTIEFLRANQHLVLDTKFFNEVFKFKLLENIENLDDEMGGLLLHSENFQALKLLLKRYKNRIKTIYIDPPYNTEKDRTQGRFLYKDSFEHSSWLSMLADRLKIASIILATNGAIFCSIDDNENFHLRKLLDYSFGSENYLYEIVWNLGTGTQAGHFTRSHEYIQSYASDKANYPSFRSTRSGSIKHGALKKISYANPASEITFPAGMEFEGQDAIFSGEIGGSEKQIIEGEMIFKNGLLSKPVTIEAGWAMRNQVLSWIKGNETLDTKGQKVLKFFFNSQGILWYEKERKTEHPPSVFSGVASTKDGSTELDNLVPNNDMSFPKPPKLIKKIIQLSTDKKSIVLDFFAGSGTTAQAVIDLNKESGESNSYVLVEMGEYFDSILKPRIQRVIYSEDWKDGKPVSRKGFSHAFKYMKLESYEDTLNNLELTHSQEQNDAMFSSDAFREEYLLSYMLDIESQGSLLSIKSFETPFDYKLQIATDTVGETVSTKIDLVETFNYLIGLKVEHISRIKDVVVVEGTTRQGEKTLIIWRNVNEMDNEELDQFFEKLDIRTRDFEYDVIYVNGDNNLPNLRSSGENWKVRLIEEDFLRLMFDVEDN